MEPHENRYAVPLGTLVAGAYVSLTDQVEVHDVSAPPPPQGGGQMLLDGGADVDGD